MKKYIISICLLIAALSGFAQQIEFFNVGPQDKPMDCVIISTREIESEYAMVGVLVTEKEYAIVKKHVIRKNTHKHLPADAYIKNNRGSIGRYEFGCYAVQITDNKDSLLYFMDTNEESVNYFKELVRFLEKKNLTKIAQPIQSIIDSSHVIFVDEDGNEVFIDKDGNVIIPPPRNQYKYWIIGGIGCCFLIFLLIVKFRKH
jgi:hypothetical protein